MNTHRLLRSFGAALGLVGLVAGAASAQLSSTPRSLGMSGAYVATARGYEALFLNPANLGLPGTPYWSVAVPQVNLASGTTGPSFGDTWELVQASGKEPARKAELLALVPDQGMDVHFNARIPLVAFQNRRFALGAAYGVVLEQSLGRDLFDLFVNGYRQGRTDYQVGNTTGSRATFFDFAAAYGRRVGPLSVGATGHFVLGRTLARTRLFDPRIDPSAESIEVEYREVLVRGGHGYGLDLGAALQPLPNLTLSAAVANVAARMQWSEDLLTRSLVATQEDFGAPTMHWEARFSGFLRSDTPVDPEAAPLAVFQTAQELYHEAYFPTTLRAGASYHVPFTRTHLEVGYQEHLTAGRLGDAWDRRVSAGIQQKLPLITVRAGAASNLEGATQLGAGISLGGLEVGVARIQHPAESTQREWYVASIGLSARTTGSLR